MAKAPSVLDRIKELRAEEAKLLEEAKAAALAKAEEAVGELSELGFTYRLVEGSTTKAPTPRAPSSTGARRSGIRESVLAAITENSGIAPAQIRDKLGMTTKSDGYAVSNALTALKNAGKIVANVSGGYEAA